MESRRTAASSGNGKATVQPELDPITGAPVRPDGAGMYLHWDGRKNYRTRMPVPRVLEPVDTLSFGPPDGNLIIEGDNLQVMVSLRPQYRSTVDIAYIDAPYNTGKKDFRYSDRRFHDPNADSDDSVYVTNEDGGRHTKWLNYMAPRLFLTHEMLADHGVCFVSINDIELYRIGMLMDEIFGESNRIGILVWKQQVDNNPTRIAVEHEYILCYAKSIESVPEQWEGVSLAKEWLLDTYQRIRAQESHPAKIEKLYRAAIREQKAAHRKATEEGRGDEVVDVGRMERYRNIDENGPWAKDWHLENPRAGGYIYDILHPVTKKACKKPPKGYRHPQETMQRLLADDMIVFGKDETEPPQLRRYLKDSGTALRSVINIPGRLGSDTLRALFPDGAARFAHPKPVELMTLLLEASGDPDALVFDPFAGSGTTGHAVLRLNARDRGRRRVILIEEGSREDRYCRTLTAPRLQAAIEKEELAGGFTFLETGRRLNREAILDLERQAITSLIIQTDITGAGRGIHRLDGVYVIGSNARREAICLHWNGRSDSAISGDVLTKMFDEVKERGLLKPLRVYGTTCVVSETDSFSFCQIPDEIIAALNMSDEADELAKAEAIATVETLESAGQGLVVPVRDRR